MRRLSLMFVIPSMLVACTPTGLKSPGPSDEFAWTNRAGAKPEDVRIEMLKCGNGRYLSNVIRINGESSDNAAARLEECLFAKGFFPKSGNGGRCSDLDYRAKLPACKDAPIRPSTGYYGQGQW